MPSTYTAENVKDLSITTPTENDTPPSEINNAIREVKDVIKNQWATIVKSSAYTLTPQDSLVLVSGTTTITVPASTDVSSSTFLKEYTIIKTDAAGTNVTIARTDSDTFNAATSLTLTVQYESVRLFGSGVADWKVKSLSEARLVLADNTTNDVSTSKHGFCPKAPNDTEKFLRGDATWNTVPSSPTTSIFGQISTGSGGAATTSAWTKRTLDTTVVNNISGCSIASSQITLPAGTYHCRGFANFMKTNFGQIALYDTTGAAYLVGGGQVYTASADTVLATSIFETYFTLSVQSVLELRYYCTLSTGGDDLGQSTAGTVTSQHALISITKV